MVLLLKDLFLVSINSFASISWTVSFSFTCVPTIVFPVFLLLFVLCGYVQCEDGINGSLDQFSNAVSYTHLTLPTILLV